MTTITLLFSYFPIKWSLFSLSFVWGCESVVCVRVWKPSVNLQCWSQEPSTLFFETESLTGSWDLPIRLGQLASWMCPSTHT